MSNNQLNDVIQFMKAAEQTTEGNNEEQGALYMKLIGEEMTEFAQAVRENDDTEILDAIFDMIWVMYAYGVSRGWNMSAAWNEGTRSNLAKVDPTTGKLVKRPDGKVQKPEGWTPPNFAQFVK